MKNGQSDFLNSISCMKQNYITLSALLMIFFSSCSQVPTKEIPALTIPKEVSKEFISPIKKWFERITKKTFWLKVSPNNSPVSPEKFSGYHTGIDFETFPWEENSEITITALCSGPLIMKKWGTGYGGVAVQRCKLGKEIVTVVYGHLKLASIEVTTNTELKTGEKLGILGKWYSSETDNERKHLHLSIHKWNEVNIRGYAATLWELNQWLDPLKYIQ